MKKVLAALVCTLGAVACGEGRPAEDPSTRTTSVTTEVNSTEARPNRAAVGTTKGTTNASANPSRSNAATTGVAPADGTGSQSGSGVQAHGSVDGSVNGSVNGGSSVGGSTNASAAGNSNAGANAPSTNNPGVANGTKDADNTKINDRDRHGALTPMDQGGGKDRDITAAIRRAVVGDGALSFTAKNVKIITVGGKVTLRGPVKSDAEKTAIESKAKATAGVSEVDNQLEVKK